MLLLASLCEAFGASGSAATLANLQLQLCISCTFLWASRYIVPGLARWVSELFDDSGVLCVEKGRAHPQPSRPDKGARHFWTSRV